MDLDLIHNLFNLVARPFTFFSLYLFFPPFYAFKFLFSTLSSVFSESVEGKVALITGASSGIGEYLAYEHARRGACLALVAQRRPRWRKWQGGRGSWALQKSLSLEPMSPKLNN